MLAVDQTMRGEMHDAVLADFRTRRGRLAGGEIRGLQYLAWGCQGLDRVGFFPRKRQSLESSQARVSGRPGEFPLAECLAILRCRGRGVPYSRVVRLKYGIGQYRYGLGCRLSSRNFLPQDSEYRRRGQIHDLVIGKQRLAGAGQCSERNVLQGVVADDQESFPSQLPGHWPQKHSAQASQRELGLSLKFPLMTGFQQLISLFRGGLDLGPFGQFETLDRRRRHRPKIATIVAKRIFKEQRIFVEDLLLDVLQRQRLGLRERRIARTRGADTSFNLLVIGQ
jgi:hypothetical protein